MRLKYFFFVFVILFINVGLFAQVTTVKGRVIDAETEEPLIGASVYAGGDEGTVADIDGRFEIVTSSTKLEISYLGYAKQKVQVTSNYLEIRLQPDTTNLIVCYIIDPVFYNSHPSITKLPARDLKINNQTSITPSLNLIPGVFMHSGALNTNRITIRGIGNRNLFGTAKIKAYLDGIPITNGSGETELEDIDLSILNGVTVYKGPSSSIYGAGLGGMIKLEIPDQIYNKQENLSLESTIGSYGLKRNILNYRKVNKERSILNLNAGTTFSDGYRENNNYQRINLNGFGKFKLSNKESFKFLVNYVNLIGEIPSSLDSTDYVDNPEQAAFIWGRAKGREQTRKVLAGIAYDAQIGDHIRQSTSIFGQSRESNERRPFNILREVSIVKGARTEWVFSKNDLLPNSNKFEFHLGGELYYENYNWQTYSTDGQGSRGNLISDNNEEREYYNLFAQTKLDFNYATRITLGVNLNSTEYDFTDYYIADGDASAKRKFSKIVSPFLNLGLDLDSYFGWNTDLNASMTVSHGFSPPTLEETLQPDGQVNSKIQPEQGWNFELGLRGSSRFNMEYAVTFYSMQIEDLLVARRTDFDQFVGMNAGKTVHNGLELALNFNFYSDIGRFAPFLNYTYSNYKFKDFIDDDNDYSGNQLTGTAPHLLNTGVQFYGDQFYGNVIYRFVDAMPMRDDNSIYSDAYSLVDLKLGYKYTFAKQWTVDLFAGINNLLDEKYASMILINAGSFGGNAPRYYYPGLPRNYYLGLRVGMGK